MRFPSLTDHQQLVFWVDLVVVVAAAVGLGRLARRIGQPPVVGELFAGILLGPSVLGHAWPGGFRWLFAQGAPQAGLLSIVGWVGVAFLLVITGFETDLGIVRRVGRAAGAVAVLSLLVPLGVGLVLGRALPASFVGLHAHRGVFVIFAGVALSISSLPVIAKILSELGMVRRDFGQVTLAVGTVNDLVGWVALGVIASLARSGRFSPGVLLSTIGVTVALVAGVFVIGQPLVDAALRRVRSRTDSVVEVMTLELVIVIAVAAVAQAAHLEAVLGAFLAGIVLGRSAFQHPQVRAHLESVTLAVLAPVFFAISGLRVDVALLSKPSTLMWAAIVLVAAVASKFIGAFVGARLGGLDTREGLALGAALNARGAVEVVIASVGLALGVLSVTAYTVVVLMAIVTSVMAPPLLRAVASNWRGRPEEQERLEQEELLNANVLVGPGRLLLPSRAQANSIVAAQVLHFAWPPDVPVTVLSVGEDTDLSAVHSVLHDRPVDVRHVDGGYSTDEILAEARLGYAVIAVGASENPSEGRILSSVVDDLLLAAPCPVLIVRRARGQATTTPSAFARALVPVTGSPSSRAAQEVAFGLSRQLGTSIVATHIMHRPDASVSLVGARAARRGGPGPADAAVGVLDQASRLAQDFSVPVETVVRRGTSPAEEILGAARQYSADLIVMGATVRRLEGRPFLGHTVEHVLAEAPQTVVVAAIPAREGA